MIISLMSAYIILETILSVLLYEGLTGRVNSISVQFQSTTAIADRRFLWKKGALCELS